MLEEGANTVRCHNCNQNRPDDAAFCPSCGVATAASHAAPATSVANGPAPAATPPSGPAVVSASQRARSFAPVVMFAIVALALVLGGAAFLVGRDSSSETSGAPGTGATANSTSSADSATIASTTVASTVISSTIPSTISSTIPSTIPSTIASTTIAQDPVETAAAQLVLTIDEDRAAVDSVLGSWVPQISAKRDGLEWEGVTYDLPLIAALHRELDDRYGALLVSGADYNFQIDNAPMSNWFITIADASFPNPDGALDWCRDNSIDRENCAAKLITNDQAANPTLVLQ